MWNKTDRPGYEAGIRLLAQEYHAALADIARQNLTRTERLRLQYNLEQYEGTVPRNARL